MPNKEFASYRYSPVGAQLGNFKDNGCKVEMGHKDTGFPIETLGPAHASYE